NHISLYSWHMNGGHYSLTSNFQLTVRLGWSEFFAFASGPEEVLGAVQKNRKLNTRHADLALLANSCQLPVQPPKTRYVDFPVTIVNLGVVASEPAKVAMLSDDTTLAEADVPPLRPGEQRLVTMRLDGRLPKVRFVIKQQEPDFDPTNDTL